MGFLTLLPLLGLTWYLSERMRISASAGLLFAVSGSVLLLFCAGLVGALWWAAAAIHVVGTVLLGAAAWHTLRGTIGPWDAAASPWILLIASAVFWYVYRQDQYFFFDEYSHWGVYVREIHAWDEFWRANTNALHPRYVPGPALFQYLFTFFGQPTEPLTYLAQFVLLATPLLMLFANMRLRQVPWLIGTLALCLAVLTNYSLGVRSLYVDHLLGAWLLGVVLCYMLERDVSARRLAMHAVALSTVALIKDAGLAFALAGAAVIAVLWAGRTRRIPAPVAFRAAKTALAFIALAAPALICSLAWSWNRDLVGAPHDVMSTGGIVAGLASALREGLSSTTVAVSALFLDTFLNQSLANNSWFWQLNEFTYPVRAVLDQPGRMTTMGLFAVFALWWTLLTRFVLDDRARWEWRVAGWGLFLTAAGYVGLLLSSYSFAFADRGILLPSYTRYVNTITVPLVLLCFVPLLPGFAKSAITQGDHEMPTAGHIRAMLFAAGLALLYLVEKPLFDRILLPNPRIELRRQLGPGTLLIKEAIKQSSIWVHFPGDVKNGFAGELLQFLLTPAPTSIERSTDFLRQDRSALFQVWRKYDYLWFAGPVDPGFAQMLGELAGGGPMTQLFRVHTDDAGHFSLESVPLGSASEPGD